MAPGLRGAPAAFPILHPFFFSLFLSLPLSPARTSALPLALAIGRANHQSPITNHQSPITARCRCRCDCDATTAATASTAQDGAKRRGGAARWRGAARACEPPLSRAAVWSYTAPATQPRWRCVDPCSALLRPALGSRRDADESEGGVGPVSSFSSRASAPLLAIPSQHRARSRIVRDRGELDMIQRLMIRSFLGLCSAFALPLYCVRVSSPRLQIIRGAARRSIIYSFCSGGGLRRRLVLPTHKWRSVAMSTDRSVLICRCPGQTEAPHGA